jgi:DNA-directed RNA polymerase subunit RPC12/RpoP
MQIDVGDCLCPACGAAALEFFAVLHHMPCAFVGPAYDFSPSAAGYVCPKCGRGIAAWAPDCEIVGTSARCRCCRAEIVVSPPAPVTGSPENRHY